MLTLAALLGFSLTLLLADLLAADCEYNELAEIVRNID